MSREGLQPQLAITCHREVEMAKAVCFLRSAWPNLPLPVRAGDLKLVLQSLDGMLRIL